MPITIDTVPHQGQISFRIATPACTYLYHIEGCGFASLLDRNGLDWISYRPEGGPHGHFRGIPNMGWNVFGHPGYDMGASSEIEQVGDDHVRIRSRSADGAWQTHWDIFADHATQTVESIGRSYWWLYEGTPGGRFCPDEQYLLLPDGTRHPCRTRNLRNTKITQESPRWVAFGDPATGRALLLAAHDTEPTVDQYWPMGHDDLNDEGGMTVFGFGRDDLDGPHPLLTQTPTCFSFALVESEEFGEIEVTFQRIHEQAIHTA